MGAEVPNLEALVTVAEYGDPYVQAIASDLALAVVHESCHLATSTVDALTTDGPFNMSHKGWNN